MRLVPDSLWVEQRREEPVALIVLGQGGIVEAVLDHARRSAVASGRGS